MVNGANTSNTDAAICQLNVTFNASKDMYNCQDGFQPANSVIPAFDPAGSSNVMTMIPPSNVYYTGQVLTSIAHFDRNFTAVPVASYNIQIVDGQSYNITAFYGNASAANSFAETITFSVPVTLNLISVMGNSTTAANSSTTGNSTASFARQILAGMGLTALMVTSILY